jgi:hypothetical protein
MNQCISSQPVIWSCRVVLAAYCALMIFIAHGAMENWSETLRLLDGEAICSAVPLKCGAINSLIDLIIQINAVELAIVSEVAWRWRYRHYARVGAVVLGVGHLLVNVILVQIGYAL